MQTIATEGSVFQLCHFATNTKILFSVEVDLLGRWAWVWRSGYFMPVITALVQPFSIDIYTGWF